MRRRATLTHEKLVEEARFLLEKLQRVDVFGERVPYAEAERVLEPSLSVGFAELSSFLTKYGYLRLEDGIVTVTSGGIEAAVSDDAEFHARLARHFARELTAASGRPRSEPTAPPLASSFEGVTAVTRSRRPLGGPPEEVLDRRYRRGSLVGQGSLGVVHRGTHVGLGRPVALKEATTVFQYASYLRRDEVVRRLRTAVEAQARLHHPHILQILDQNPEREHPYFVLELAAGGNLRARLDAAKDRQLDLRVAVRVVTQLAHALRNAHNHGVLHLGLKPENVLFDGLGNVKLADFGFARVLEHPEGSGPAPVLVGGNTVAYLAPERLQPGPPPDLGPPADVYALGILLYEMLGGRLPGRRSPLPSETREGVPAAFDEVFDRMTRDDVDERYGTIDEVLDGIHEAFGPEFVFERGTMLAWADDPSPLPAAPEPEVDSADLVVEPSPISEDLPVPPRVVLRRAPPLPVEE